MTDKQEKPKRQRKKKPPEKKRLSEQQLATFDEIFGAGFSTWYRNRYDEEGNLLESGLIPGLRPPGENESEE